MNVQTNSCVDDDCSEGIFKSLNNDQLEFAKSVCKQVYYKAGEYIIKQGTFAKQIAILKTGKVKIFTQNGDLVNMLSLETDNAILGLPALFSINVYSYSVVPFENAKICLFDIEDFQKLIIMNGTFASEVINQMNDYTNRSFDRLHCLTHKQVYGRFADILICLSERIYRSLKFEITLTRKEIAEMCVMSAESLSRVIKELNDDGLLSIDGRFIEIHDLEKLKKLSLTS